MNGLKRKRMEHKDPRKVLNQTCAESYPACFNDARQYRDYIWLMRQAAEPKDHGFCLDCTPEHKAKMLQEQRCSHPETKFVVWANRFRETEVIGVSNRSRYWNRVCAGQTILNWGEDGEDKQSSEG
jgi:hypothetical protein